MIRYVPYIRPQESKSLNDSGDDDDFCLFPETNRVGFSVTTSSEQSHFKTRALHINIQKGNQPIFSSFV